MENDDASNAVGGVKDMDLPWSIANAHASRKGRNRRSSGRFGRAWESVDIDLALKGLHGENIGRRW